MRELVISSPAKKNALSTAVLESLARDLPDAEGEPVLLTGAGRVVSAGLEENLRMNEGASTGAHDGGLGW